MIKKTLRSDIELLRKILKHQEGINETLKEMNLKSLIDIKKSNVALKALALDVSQIGELADKLTSETTESLKIIDVKLAYSIRNRISHAYLAVKPDEIALTAMQISSEPARTEIKHRIKFCVSNCNS